MKRPIAEGLANYKKQNPLRMHMPGHKGQPSGSLDWGQVYAYDVTEVEGTDNLMAPEGIIKESLEQMAAYYGTESTFISVNGSTGGLIGAILAATKPGDRVIMPRDSHRSIYNALILGDLEPIYLEPVLDGETGIALGWETEKLADYLEQYRPAAVILGYPNYYGICTDIRVISEISHQYDAAVIVDEAHGAHLPFSEHLPNSAIHMGADIVVQSTHKMLAGMTQTALVHLCSARISPEKLNHFLFLTQTTSPSYIFMASIENAFVEGVEEGSQGVAQQLKAKAQFKEKLSQLQGISLYDKAYFKGKGAWDFDESKVILSAVERGYTGYQLQSYLEAQNIQVEMADSHQIVALTTYKDKAQAFEKIYKALKCIPYNQEKSQGIITESMAYKPAERVYSMKTSNYKDFEWTDLEGAAGKVSKTFIIPYPPGYPFICPGEKLNQEHIQQILKHLAAGQKIVGIKEGKVQTIIESL